MTLFNYKAINQSGAEIGGSIDAVSEDVAINSLQRRGLVISAIKSTEESASFLNKGIGLFDRVSNKDVVILSRQIATLFEAQVSALRVFRLLAAEAENPTMRKALSAISDDMQSGMAISKALSKHPKVFSTFYVNMVSSGEESGKLDQTFMYLADYLDRTYEVGAKARNALIYPAFVITTFIAVMILMLTTVIPRLSSIIQESGKSVPVYTQVVIAISNFLINYGIFLIILLVVGAFFLWRYARSKEGMLALSHLKIDLPYIGTLYRKLYLSRIADNMNTMLISGIPMVRAIEITGSVVDNRIYEAALAEATEAIRGGSSVADAFASHKEIPGIMVQMIRIGEETGELGNILKTLATFYRREVNNAVDTLVDLIEPAMIVLLGLGVGLLLASVLIPIYNISSSI